MKKKMIVPNNIITFVNQVVDSPKMSYHSSQLRVCGIKY